jgi:NAD(P)-dependent dehydrogenase (short-subunit alcohol dehydrogenase family)
MQKGTKKRELRKPQHQSRPGRESLMQPKPVSDDPEVRGSGKLKGRVALITGGDSGIGKAVAILFAKEGADIAIAYLNEHNDAKETAAIIEKTYGRRCLLIPGDIRSNTHCKKIAKKTIDVFGKLHILVNNAAVHYEDGSLEKIDDDEMLRTFETNVFSFFRLTRELLRFFAANASIINTSSVTAFRGSAGLITYSSTKGAIVAFTRSLSASLIKKGIRVNGVAPGPVWTPLIVSSFKGKKVAEHGSDSPMGRAAQPVEIAPCYLFLASDDSRYITGQFIHPNGGEIING